VKVKLSYSHVLSASSSVTFFSAAASAALDCEFVSSEAASAALDCEFTSSEAASAAVSLSTSDTGGACTFYCASPASKAEAVPS